MQSLSCLCGDISQICFDEHFVDCTCLRYGDQDHEIAHCFNMLRLRTALICLLNSRYRNRNLCRRQGGWSTLGVDLPCLRCRVPLSSRPEHDHDFTCLWMVTRKHLRHAPPIPLLDFRIACRWIPLSEVAERSGVRPLQYLSSFEKDGWLTIHFNGERSTFALEAEKQASAPSACLW